MISNFYLTVSAITKCYR